MEKKKKKEIEQEIKRLKAKLTGDMFRDMDVRDKIHNLEMMLNGTKPGGQHIECVGCGS